MRILPLTFKLTVFPLIFAIFFGLTELGQLILPGSRGTFAVDRVVRDLKKSETFPSYALSAKLLQTFTDDARHDMGAVRTRIDSSDRRVVELDRAIHCYDTAASQWRTTKQQPDITSCRVNL